MSQFIASPVLDNKGDDVDLHDDHEWYEDEDNIVLGFASERDENFFPLDEKKGYLISGLGDSRENCGKFRSAWASENRQWRHKRFNCHRQGCPKCFRIWAVQQAEKSAGYMWGVNEHTGEILSHWTFSPEKSQFTTWEALESLLFSAMKKFYPWEKTVLSVVRHPRRIKCRWCDYSPPTHKLPVICPECKANLPWIWAFGPHLHLITNFHFKREDTNEYVKFMKENGVILKQIVMLNTKDHLVKVMAYEFGHALYNPRQSPVIRYFAFSAKKSF